MRAIQSVAVLSALALAIPAPAPAAILASPLSSIFKCEASGGKQVPGAAIGGAVGGIAGNRLAKGDRGLGTVLGAAIGAAAGSYIGCRMQKSDQVKAERAAQEALNRNRNASWSNPETGASGNVRMVSASGKPISMSGLKFASGVEPASGYEGASGRYQARGNANLRGGPSTTSKVVGKLAPGQSIDALARVQGSNWLLAGRDGVGVGYVAESVVSPVGGGAAAGECRTFDQTLKTKSGAPETKRYTACKNASGEWVVEA